MRTQSISVNSTIPVLCVLMNFLLTLEDEFVLVVVLVVSFFFVAITQLERVECRCIGRVRMMA